MIVQDPRDSFVTERALRFNRYLISSDVGQCNAFATELRLDDHAIDAFHRQDNVVSYPISGSLIRTDALFGLNKGHLSDAFANRTGGAGIIATLQFLGAGARPLELKMTFGLKMVHAESASGPDTRPTVDVASSVTLSGGRRREATCDTPVHAILLTYDSVTDTIIAHY